MAEPNDLDGCELDFTEDADSEMTAAMRPLFPDGKQKAKRKREWEELFGDAS